MQFAYRRNTIEVSITCVVRIPEMFGNFRMFIIVRTIVSRIQRKNLKA